MNPGATTRPDASIVRLARDPESRPTAAIFPPRTPTSARNQGAPVPSTTRALVNKRSKPASFAGGGAAEMTSRAPARSSFFMRPVYDRLVTEAGARAVALLEELVAIPSVTGDEARVMD